MKWGLNVSLKYLTPSSALRDSRLRSPCCVSASPTSLFFSAGPRFPASSTVRSSQSSISSSYLNQEVDPSKSGGIFVRDTCRRRGWSLPDHACARLPRWQPKGSHCHLRLLQTPRHPRCTGSDHAHDCSKECAEAL